MGNKRITEKDFWQCTNGAVPAQLQGTNTSTTKKSGEKYITIQDKATSSWIDFGCTKLMLIYALLAAAVVVIAAMTVATGGAALIALGAIAGLAGAAWGAIVGTMLCGHLGAKIRDWVPVPKDRKTLVQGAEQITGDYKMLCKIPGGIVTFAPQIKNWSQAVSLGASNYIGKLMEGMMAGAAVGMGGALISGGAGAFASGGLRGMGQAALQFAKSMPKNFVVNAIESVSKVGLALRGVMGVQNTAAVYGNTGTASVTDFGSGVVAMETGAYDSFNNIREGKGTWQDWVGMAMMIAPVGQGKRDLENSLKNEPDSSNNKVDDAENSKVDEEDGAPKTEVQDGDAPKQEGDGEAYESTPIPEKIYDTTPMNENYRGEETGNGWCSPKKVKYLTNAERAKLKLEFKDGKVFDSEGNLYDTSDAGTFFSGKGKSIFVMDSQGNIFASKYQAVGEFHHSSILGGEPVSGAGEIAVKDGVITEISNRSGHYQPDQITNSQVIDQVGSQGIKIEDINITGY